MTRAIRVAAAIVAALPYLAVVVTEELTRAIRDAA